MIGSTIGHYELLAELGRGTFGVVYRARHVRIAAIEVAVKVVHPKLTSDSAFIASLERECTLLHGLKHPNIVDFRDLLIDGEDVAMVLEYLNGRDLHDVFQQGQLSIGRTVDFLDQTLSGLAFAHGKGVVHRDIKPSNLYWNGDGRVKLLDFGVSKAAQGTQATPSGQITGTLDYMSPERFRGESPDASDLYALGLVAWELLVGKRACPDGDMAHKFGWHMAVGVSDVRVTRPSCPVWLAELVAAMTHKDVAQRLPSASEGLAILRRRATPEPASTTAGHRAPPSTVTLDGIPLQFELLGIPDTPRHSTPEPDIATARQPSKPPSTVTLEPNPLEAVDELLAATEAPSKVRSSAPPGTVTLKSEPARPTHELPPPPESDSEASAADVSYDMGELEQRAFSGREPDLEALGLLAMACCRAGRSVEAFEVWRQYLRDDGAGGTLLSLDLAEQIHSVFDSAEPPGDVLIDGAQVALFRGLLDRAEQRLTHAMGPCRALAHTGLGVVAWLRGDPERASRHAIEAHGSSNARQREATAVLALAHQAQGKHDAAKRRYARIPRTRRAVIDAHAGLLETDFLLSAGRQEEALTSIAALVEASRGRSQILARVQYLRVAGGPIDLCRAQLAADGCVYGVVRAHEAAAVSTGDRDAAAAGAALAARAGMTLWADALNRLAQGGM